MLLSFSIQNYRSIKNEQFLSMEMDKGDECLQNCFEFNNEKEKFNLLKSIIIYGANGSGKSNLIRGMHTLKRLVTNDSLQDITPFRLHKDSISEPTLFEISFIVENIRYRYMVIASSKRVYEESLYQYPNGRMQVLFERLFNSSIKNYEWNFGNSLRGQKIMWRDATRYDQLFLKKASDNNSEQLMVISNYFKNNFNIILNTHHDTPPHASIEQMGNEESKKKIIEYLRKADFGISEITVKEEAISAENLPTDIPDFLRDILLSSKNSKHIDISTVRESETLGNVSFNFNDESTGTQKYFGLAGHWIEALSKGGVLIVDELQNTLHPKLVQYLTGLFNNDKTNPNNAQLIFTSHDISLLLPPVKFRRDQILICDKNNKNETEVFSLIDFSVRKDKLNFAKDYLNGRFGGIPFIQEYF